jgi:cyclic pyranopterin phosphate synthase
MSILTDRFGRRHSYLRISLTDRCNLRCTYCMPAEGIPVVPPARLMSAAEIVTFARLFVAQGVDKIRLTGGEPTLRRDLLPLVEELGRIEGLRTLAMTTNGLTLARDAGALGEAGLDSLTISLDTLRRDRFVDITRRDRLADVLAGIEAALAAGFAPLKLNAVMMQGVNEDELLEFVALTKDRPLHVRFIEYMPFHGTGWDKGDLLPYQVMKARIGEVYELTPLLTEASAVGRDFAIPGHAGAIGFVTSMTESFCGGCNRLRLTADGALKSCLFSNGETGLLEPLRAGAGAAELAALIRLALAGKPEKHPPMEDLLAMDNRAMVAIGG